jgi:phage repressor protein C with HTH and peptisase S24 domain
MSLRADDLWAAIEQLAREHGWTSSGLARRAGLDPTAFNRSKRRIHEHDRWPASSSIAKVLDATGESFMEFAARVTVINQTRQAPGSLDGGELASRSNAVPRTRRVSVANSGRA